MSSFFSCGEDQTAAWSQVAHHNQQAAVSFDGSAAAPIAVSTGLLRDIEGHSHFTATRPGLDLRTHSQRLGQHRVRAAQSRARRCRGIRPQPKLLIQRPESLLLHESGEYTTPGHRLGVIDLTLLPRRTLLLLAS
jgi:hypothetical protein